MDLCPRSTSPRIILPVTFWYILDTQSVVRSLGVTPWFVKHSGTLLRVTNCGVANLIGSFICLEVVVVEIPVAGLMAAFGACDLERASQPY